MLDRGMSCHAVVTANVTRSWLLRLLACLSVVLCVGGRRGSKAKQGNKPRETLRELASIQTINVNKSNFATLRWLILLPIYPSCQGGRTTNGP
ncbi:hypothetical protein B0H63DRAFT_482121 [Podospora didyma]|uniref:Secreted protein n=1 Tax=Podospora didyma TaxID=330526 RepID=A0AAE0N8Y8_9PEZI|nr:hypothetical protein B0H63DRAFT_482121 [Podospora didyma]